MTVIDEAVPAGKHFVSIFLRSSRMKAKSQVECMLLGAEGKTTAPFKMLGV